jgi:hypothetical protein
LFVDAPTRRVGLDLGFETGGIGPGNLVVKVEV